LKSRIFLGTLFLFITVCDRQLVGPLRDNPFDTKNEITSGDPFNLQTKNLSDHILITWEYTYDTPVPENYRLYRVNSSGIDTLYTGTNKTFQDNSVEWDSTYSYYVTAIINTKETQPTEVSELPEIIRRIYVGEGMGYTNIGSALEIVDSGNVVYVMPGSYTESIDFKGKKFTLYCAGEAGSCILDGQNSKRVVTFSGGEDATTILDGFTIINGKSSGNGGGIVIHSSQQLKSSPLIINCIISNNETSGYGGALSIGRAAMPIIRGCIFNNNNALNDGGAIFCDWNSKPKIENCTFTGNISTAGNGGAITADEATPVITSCTFNSNQALAGSGGALNLTGVEDVTINLSDFTSNEAKKGGAVNLDNCNDIQFTQCRFTSNISIHQGGGFYIHQSGQLQPISIENCILWKQSAGSGGAIYIFHTMYSGEKNIRINHCTIVGNKAEGLGQQSVGGGMYLLPLSNVEVSNSIFWQNTSDYIPLNDPGNNISDIYDGGLSSFTTVTYTNIVDWEGVGNITTDNPLFTDPENEDFTIQPTSPCKDAADPNDALDTDGTRADMGAHGGSLGDWE